MKAKIIKRCSICGKNLINHWHREYYKEYLLCVPCESKYVTFRESEEILKIFIDAIKSCQ